MKDQDVGTGRRLDVESGHGEGMDESVEVAKVFCDAEKCVDKEFAEDCIDAKNCVHMGLG